MPQATKESQKEEKETLHLCLWCNEEKPAYLMLYNHNPSRMELAKHGMGGKYYTTCRKCAYGDPINNLNRKKEMADLATFANGLDGEPAPNPPGSRKGSLRAENPPRNPQKTP